MTEGSTIAGLVIQSVSESTDYVNSLIYGDPGVGKTRLAASASLVPSMSPVLLLNIEAGTKSIKSLYPDVQRVDITDELDSGGRIKRTAWEKVQEVYEALMTGNHPYKTVIIDNLTEGQKLSMASILVRSGSADGVPTLREWGMNGEQVRKMVRAFRDMPCHTIFTAWAQTFKDDQTGVSKIKPSLTGKLADEVPGYLDEVFYMYVKPDQKGEDVKRFLLSQPTNKHQAKDRSGRMPVTIESPTMDIIATYVLD